MKYRDCQLMKTNEKDTHQRIVPALRFPEFQNSGEWDMLHLNQISSRITTKVGKSQLTPVSISAGVGFIAQTEKFGRDISGDQYHNYIELNKGEFAYNKGNSKKYPQGCVYKLEEFDKVAAPNAFICFRFNDNVIPDFFKGYFDNNYHGRQLQNVITSGARSNGLLNISADNFFNIILPTPKDKKEQQKIADCLSSIDSLIKATEDKIDLLKAHKKGLMQQLFPAEGETTPKLRFPEFQNAGEWESHPITKFFTRLTSRNTDNNTNILTISAQHGLVSQREYFNKVVAAENISNYFLLHKGDFAYNKSSSQDYPQGVIKCLKLYEIGIVSPLYICMKIKDTNEISFFEQYFESGMINPEIKKIAQEGARNHGLLNVSIKDFFNTVSLIVPRSIEERKKIADCLSSIDMLINVTEDKIALLKAHKKGLMQQLFPNTNNCEV